MTWSAAWEALTAAGTIAMAITTGVVIRQNTRQRQEIARQHQDSFRPICILVPDEGQDAVARRDIVKCHEEPTNPFKYLSIKASVKNIGCGPALKLSITVCSLQNPVLRPQAELEPLGSKQRVESPIKVQVFENNIGNFQAVPGNVWELWLTYEDVFGNIFHTRHSKNPQQSWTIVGEGEIKAPLTIRPY